ncbi:MAG: LLM class flavin-dependent oxidoreductase [Gammaproteobacteria bacterium]|nr:LLM class flavin-dependent oxidoreductase [Gammaproteobacteria bacterium]
MKYAINIINFGDCGDAATLAELARTAEDVGWDGFFVWDHIAWDGRIMPMVDPWVALTAIATSTNRIRIGPMVTPLPRRRPWKFARETVSLDYLSSGRMIVGVGIGDALAEFKNLGEVADLKTRGAMLDEGLKVVNGLWSGKQFSYVGEHYTVKDAQFLPATLQQPRIPIWVGGKWPNKVPFRRAAQWDGVFPIFSGTDPESYPAQIREMILFVLDHRESDDPFDVTVQGTTPGNDLMRAADVATEYAEAGVTWWQEAINERRPDLIERAGKASWLDAVRWRIKQGPPRM